ncbi:GNAT family N-acetyltransferase [Cellulomonas sp. DKR-3]|uniref:GNAT family N-acetyltransferase n=2 Tax=Cellulomonas fulva TaxID=2835530 RepID=A0ABS5TXJ3_9CELL|nr:GNAT family N-acetyltransferase [Cellulomonas fulva]
MGDDTTADDLTAVARVLGEAFADDPVIMGLVGGGRARRDRATHLFTALLRAEAGDGAGTVVDVARDDDGAVLGVAVWERPGTHGATLPALVGQAPTFLRALGVTGVPRALTGRQALARCRPEQPHWYLGQIGVTAVARGTGVGSSLLEHRLRAADGTGVGAYLESSTERNRALYRRFGFEEQGEIPGVPAARPVAMWREPAPVTV